MNEKKTKTVKKKSTAREILEWILTIIAAVAIALPIRAFAFEMVRVDGKSMNGTLSDGEVMFVSKFDYASTWLSLPWWDDKGKEGAVRITTGGGPQRFDVVVCRYPGRGDTNFVKRVVGLPGDTVEIREG
ncbi:MAG: signal peptidase I, partial [Clostridia bacterium]|nr:signal peptidase I [Clostridia bacterium]